MLNQTQEVYQLPCGLFRDEVPIREIVLKEMTGAVRKEMGKPENRRAAPLILDTLLKKCIVRIGDITDITSKILKEMLIADRDFCLLKIRELSLGKRISPEAICQGCNSRIVNDYNLDEFDIYYLSEDSYSVEAVGFGNDPAKKRVFSVDIPEFNLKARFRYPNGADQHFCSSIFEQNPIEAQYVMYAKTMVSWDLDGDKPKLPFSVDIFENLKSSLLDEFDNIYLSKMPGVDLTKELVCHRCSYENEVSLTISDFLFRTIKSRKKSLPKSL